MEEWKNGKKKMEKMLVDGDGEKRSSDRIEGTSYTIWSTTTRHAQSLSRAIIVFCLMSIFGPCSDRILSDSYC